LNLATPKESFGQSHEDTKRKALLFYLVTLCLRGNRFLQQSGEKKILIVIIKELKKIYVSKIFIVSAG